MSRLKRSPAPVAIVLAAAVGVGGWLGVIRAADETEASVRRVDGVEEVLTPDRDGPTQNFLLVGSDTREDNLDAAEGTSRRSDTIMILRREKGGGAALLSIPRDLWVEFPDGDFGKINGAYNQGPDVLAKTVTDSLGIPVHHYVEIDFNGFQRLVDAIGGVEICVMLASKDDMTGLNLQPGCQNLNGENALKYARSRYFEEFRDGDWRIDPRADLGRIERQQHFIREAVGEALEQIEQDPFAAGRLLKAVLASVRVDGSLDPKSAARSLRAAAEAGLVTVQIPVSGATIDGQAAVQMDEGAEPILDYFRGKGKLPADATSDTVGG